MQINLQHVFKMSASRMHARSESHATSQWMHPHNSKA